MTAQTVDEIAPFISPALNKFFKKWGFTRCGNNESPFAWSGGAYCAIIKGVAFWCPFSKYGELQGVWVIGKDFLMYDLTAANMEKFIGRNIS